jgi:putative FmdB family regulatory protein
LPIYEFICPRCEVIKEIKLNVKDAGTPIYCSKCDTLMNRIYGTKAIHYPYKERDSIIETGDTLYERGEKN